METKITTVDTLIVGGGLAGGLLAYRLKLVRPKDRTIVLESAPKLGGNHTWSFHTSDIPEDVWTWFRPLVSKSWESYEVDFPLVKKVLPSGYHSITSEHFHDFLTRELGDAIRLQSNVTQVTPTQVTLSDGSVIHARCVIDARGFGSAFTVSVGYQKFVGLDLQLDAPHGRTFPMLMDATVPQTDGFRFFYVLPWTENTLLIEDTYYADTNQLDVDLHEREILAYAQRMGWKVSSILRREIGALPIPLAKEDLSKHLVKGVPTIGVRGGFFHPTTGYSVPLAVQTAERISRLTELTPEDVQAVLTKFSEERVSDEKFFRLLNRMLFKAAEPDQRYRVLERFFTMSEELIQHFFLGSMTLKDRARVLTGKPPVSVLRAIKCIKESVAQEGGISLGI